MANLENRKRFIISLVFVIMIVFLFGLAGASEEINSPEGGAGHSVSEGNANSGSGHSADRTGDLIDLVYRFICFGLMVFICVVVIKKYNLLDILSNRSDEIRQKLEDLDREKQEAEKKSRDLEKQLRDFETKRQEIIEQYKQEGLIEKDRIITDAKLRVDQIIEQSEMTIQQEVLAAKDLLRREVVELVAEKAEKIISDEISEADQDNLINEFIEKVGNIH